MKISYGLNVYRYPIMFIEHAILCSFNNDFSALHFVGLFVFIAAEDCKYDFN